MRKPSKVFLYLAGLLAAPALTACGDMEPAPVVAPAVPARPQSDAEKMKTLRKNIRSGFGEKYRDLSATSFNGST
jgi:hypothetical protein